MRKNVESWNSKWFHTKTERPKSSIFEKEKVKGEEVIYLRVGQGADTRRYIAHVKTDANGNSYYEYELV